jgi:hypothetical protein
MFQFNLTLVPSNSAAQLGTIDDCSYKAANLSINIVVNCFSFLVGIVFALLRLVAGHCPELTAT